MEITIHVDPTVVRRQLQGMAKQAPFATALALNNVANDAQKAMQESLASRFVLRRPDFMKRTIKRERATDFARKDRLEAIVRVDPQRNLLAKFEQGGEKVPTQGGKSIAIPTTKVRRTKAEIVQKSQRPRALLASRNAQLGRVFVKDGTLRRTIGRGVARVTQVLYLFKAKVRIPKMLGFARTVGDAVEARWDTRAEEAVNRAIETAR